MLVIVANRERRCLLHEAEHNSRQPLQLLAWQKQQHKQLVMLASQSCEKLCCCILHRPHQAAPSSGETPLHFQPQPTHGSVCRKLKSRSTRLQAPTTPLGSSAAACSTSYRKALPADIGYRSMPAIMYQLQLRLSAIRHLAALLAVRVPPAGLPAEEPCQRAGVGALQCQGAAKEGQGSHAALRRPH